MPAAIPAVVGSAIASWVGSAIGGAVLFGTFTVGKLIGSVVGFAVSSLLSSALGNESGATQDNGFDSYNSFQAEARNRMQVVRSAVATRKLVYGRAVVSGPLVYAEVGGVSNELLHLVIVLAPHQIEAIDEIYLNDQPLGELDAEGFVVRGPYANRFVRVRKHLGVVGDAADAALIAESGGKWTATDTLTGCAYLYVRLYYGRDVFPGGIPNIKAEVRGKRVYDPRDATWRYSNNWALVVRDYLRTPMIDGGLGAAPDEVDDAQIGAAANVSDERIAITDTAAQVTYEYARDVTADADTAPNGVLTYGGEWGDFYEDSDGAALLFAALPTWANEQAVTVTGLGPGAGMPGGLTSGQTVYFQPSASGRPVGRIATSLANLRAGTFVLWTADYWPQRQQRVRLTQTFPLPSVLVVTSSTRRLATGDKVRLSTSGTLPAPLLAATDYYLIRRTPTTLALATTHANALAGTGITITAAGSGPITVSEVDHARYVADGTVDTSKRPLDILRDMLSAGAGTITYPTGAFRLHAGAYDTPVITLTADDLRGPVELTTRVPRRDLFNAVRGTYADPGNFWQPADFPQVGNATYAAQDGGDVIERDLELPYTISATRAQRIAKIHLEKSRQGMIVSLPCNLRQAVRLAMWDTVLLTLPALGFAAKVFRVVKFTFAADGLGVDLMLREESAASYDWAAGNETIIDPAPDTALPSPFTVAQPAAPTVTEALVEALGSAGVRVRTTVRWGTPGDAYLTGYEVRYRPQTAAEWITLPILSAPPAVIDDLAPGVYQFRVRARNGIGVFSAWSDDTFYAVAGLTAAPAAPTGFSVLGSAGLALAQWNLSDDLDVRLGGRATLRHSPLTAGAAWENGIVIGRFAGGDVQGTVPLITGTYLLKFEDSAGNYSSTAASCVVTEGMTTSLSTLATITESTAFTGAKSNTVVVSSTLKIDSTTSIDAAIDIDALPDADAFAGVYAGGSYAFATLYDGTTKATRRYEADLAVTATDDSSSPDDLVDVDAAASADGGAVNDADAVLSIAITDDDPAGVSPTWSAWTPFVVGDFNCRGAKFKVDLTVGDARHNIAIDTLAVQVKA